MLIDLSVGAGIIEGGSRSMAVVNDDDETSVVEANVGVGAGALGPVSFELTGRTAATSARPVPEAEWELEYWDVLMGVRLAREVRPRLRAFVRAGLGITVAHLAIQSATATTRDLSARGLVANLGGGIDLTLLHAPPLDVGFRGELGFRIGDELSFHETEATPRSATFYQGSLNPSGPTIVFSLFARF